MFQIIEDDREAAQKYPLGGIVRLTTFQGPRGRIVSALTYRNGTVDFLNLKGQSPPAPIRDQLRALLTAQSEEK